MPANLSRVAALRNEVVRLFPDVMYTGKVTCHDGAWLPELTEENAIHDDDMYLYEALYGRKWSDVSQDHLHQMPGGYALLTNEAFVTFLAAWLIHSLDNPSGENEIREYLIYSFSPIKEAPAVTELTRSQLRALSSEQRAVVRSLLAEFAEWECSKFLREHASEAVKFIDGLT